jgi:uncharacterized protein GlcG (DUF336 family)
MAEQLTLEAAERVVEAGKKKAGEIGVAMCIAVHDGGASPEADYDVAAAGAAAF